MAIPFIQFMRPDGRRVSVTIDMPKDVEDKAKRVIEDGFRFEIEVLMNGAVSMEVFRPKDETSLAAEICQNGPPVIAAVRKLVEDSFAQLAQAHQELPKGLL